MKYLKLLVVLLIVSCATPRVAYDFDKKANFDTYKTYNFYPQIETGLNNLDNKRLFRQVDSILQSKGFKKAATPELHQMLPSYAPPCRARRRRSGCLDRPPRRDQGCAATSDRQLRFANFYS